MSTVVAVLNVAKVFFSAVGFGGGLMCESGFFFKCVVFISSGTWVDHVVLFLLTFVPRPFYLGGHCNTLFKWDAPVHRESTCKI